MHQVIFLSVPLCPSVCHFTLTFTADGVHRNYLCAHFPSGFVGFLFVFTYVSNTSGEWEKSLTFTSTMHHTSVALGFSWPLLRGRFFDGNSCSEGRVPA